MAEWNPEKDLLAMVTDDSKILFHRFNWRRLWTISPGKCITSICWSPGGKIIAFGTEFGLILLHDVENGKILRSIKSHDVAIVCLNWAEDEPLSRDINKVPIQVQSCGKRTSCQLQDAFISKVSLSRNLRRLVLLCSGKLIDIDNVVLATLLRRAEIICLTTNEPG